MALKSGRVGIHPSQVDPITGMLLNGPTPGSISFEDLSDAQISNPEVGQTLIYNGTNWENEFSSISPTTLASLQDVSLNDLANNQIIRYNSTSEKWENEDMPAIPAAQVNSDWNAVSGVAKILNKPTIPDELTELSDVDITSAADGDYLVYDGTSRKWINSGEAPAPSYTDITVTMYGAVEDTISFNDAAGISHTEVFASGQSSKSVTFKINPTGSTSITFTSAVAKDPNNLSNDYTKTVSITSATTNIYVMPDNALYWWGYVGGNCQSMSNANGWSDDVYGSNCFKAPTYSTNSVSCAAGGDSSDCVSGIGTKNTVTATKAHIIGHSASGGVGAYLNTNASSKVVSSGQTNIDNTTDAHVTRTVSESTYYIFAFGKLSRTLTISAFWYE